MSGLQTFRRISGTQRVQPRIPFFAMSPEFPDNADRPTSEGFIFSPW